MLIFPAERNELLEIPQVLETQGTFVHMHEFSPTQYVSDIKHGVHLFHETYYSPNCLHFWLFCMMKMPLNSLVLSHGHYAEHNGPVVIHFQRIISAIFQQYWDH